jgi:hypothetical protein
MPVDMTRDIKKLCDRSFKHFCNENGVHGRDQAVSFVFQCVYKRSDHGCQHCGSDPKECSGFEIERSTSAPFTSVRFVLYEILARMRSAGIHRRNRQGRIDRAIIDPNAHNERTTASNQNHSENSGADSLLDLSLI